MYFFLDTNALFNTYSLPKDNLSLVAFIKKVKEEEWKIIITRHNIDELFKTYKSKTSLLAGYWQLNIQNNDDYKPEIEKFFTDDVFVIVEPNDLEIVQAHQRKKDWKNPQDTDDHIIFWQLVSYLKANSIADLIFVSWDRTFYSNFTEKILYDDVLLEFSSISCNVACYWNVWDIIPGEKAEWKIISSKNKIKNEQKLILHWLQSDETPFLEKVNYLTKYKEILWGVRKSEIKQSDKIISKDSFLKWHFFHNYTWDWIELVWENILKSIVFSKDDVSNQFKILEYFEKYCFENHSDEVIDILDVLKNTPYEPLKRRIAIICKGLKPKGNIAKLYHLLEYLIGSEELIVKEFAIDAVKNFIDIFSNDQIKVLLELAFTPNIPKDVTNQIGWGTKLIHQWKDLTDGIFRNASSLLWKLLQDPSKATEFIAFAMDRIDDTFSKKDIIFDDEDLFWEMEVSAWKKEELPIKNNYIWWLSELEHPSNFQYESDPKKKFSYELKNALKILRTKDKAKFLDIANIIIDQWHNLIYFEILNRVLMDHDDEIWDYEWTTIRKIVFNPNLWRVIDINEKKWYDFFQFYFSLEPSDVARFESDVMDLTIPDNKNTQDHMKAELLFTIPKDLISTEAKQVIIDYEKSISDEHKINYKLEVSENEWIQIHSWTPWTIDESWVWIKDTTKNLIDRLNEAQKDPNKFSWEISDLGRAYWSYFKNYPQDFESFYQESIEQKIDFKWRFMWYVSTSYIEYLKENFKDKAVFYDKIVDFYNLIEQRPDEKWAKINIARVLSENEYLRAEDTGTLDVKLYTRIKQLVMDISNDTDPESDKESAKSLLDLWLNSVRGIGASLLCSLAFYYPEDKDIEEQIKKLSEDKCIWIQAYLITNLVYLIPDSKNYLLCEGIVNKFRDNSNSTIDRSLVRYMFRLGNKKLEANLDFLEKIIERTTEEEVKTDAGSLLWQAFLHQVDIKNMFDKILDNKLWDSEILERIAFEFQNTLWKQLLLPDISDPIKIEMLEYYKKLLSYKEVNKDKWAVANRASFVFSNDDMPIIFFDLFKEHKIFDKTIETKQLDVNHNLNEYLLRCVENKDYLEDILDILTTQIENMPPILSDDRFSSNIAKIIEYIYDNYDWKHNAKAEKIFDEWLKYGTAKFYELFDKWYKDESNVV